MNTIFEIKKTKTQLMITGYSGDDFFGYGIKDSVIKEVAQIK